MNEPKLTRKKLYDLVWSTPLSKLAKNYQTTDSELRKICKKYEIPLPKNGYWMKIQYGKPVEVVELNENYNGADEVVFVKSVGDINLLTENRSPIDLLQLEIENDSRVNLKVPDRLVNPDKRINTIRDVILSGRGFRNDGDILKPWDTLKISATKEVFPRALRFMDTLIKALKERGHTLEMRHEFTYVIILKEEIKISCREKAKRIIVEGRYSNSSELRGTGILSFNIEGYYSKEWKDGKQKLEEQLSNIIAKLELEGIRRAEETKVREKYWAEQEAKRKVEREIEQEKKNMVEKFNLLLANSKKHNEAVIIREYIRAVEEKAMNGGEMNTELISWVKWANQAADNYDPLEQLNLAI